MVHMHEAGSTIGTIIIACMLSFQAHFELDNNYSYNSSTSSMCSENDIIPLGSSTTCNLTDTGYVPSQSTSLDYQLQLHNSFFRI